MEHAFKPRSTHLTTRIISSSCVLTLRCFASAALKNFRGAGLTKPLTALTRGGIATQHARIHRVLAKMTRFLASANFTEAVRSTLSKSLAWSVKTGTVTTIAFTARLDVIFASVAIQTARFQRQSVWACDMSSRHVLARQPNLAGRNC